MTGIHCSSQKQSSKRTASQANCQPSLQMAMALQRSSRLLPSAARPLLDGEDLAIDRLQVDDCVMNPQDDDNLAVSYLHGDNNNGIPVDSETQAQPA